MGGVFLKSLFEALMAVCLIISMVLLGMFAAELTSLSGVIFDMWMDWAHTIEKTFHFHSVMIYF